MTGDLSPMRDQMESSFAAALEGLDWEPTPRERISARAGEIVEGTGRSSGIGEGKYLSRPLPGWVGLGAIAIAAVTATSWWSILQKKAPDGSNTYTTYTTKSGQRASLVLKDGSRITLGPVTTLRVQRLSPDGKEVKVEVTGEALFRVNHSTARPFFVTAQDVVTQVLGTEFVIRAYDASLIRVAVREGRVSVQSPLITRANTAIVSSGEAASVSQSGPPVISPIEDLATDFDWANGELVLRNVTLGDALTRLSRWYGMEFKVAEPSLLNERINSVFPAEFKIVELEDVALAINARVSRSGKTFIFSRIK